MAKGFGRFLAFTAFVGAAAAGVYYYLNNDKNKEAAKADFAQDVDNFFENKKVRDYVSLDKVVSEENKEALKNAVEKATEEIKEKAEQVAEKIGIIREDSSAEAADFAFKEFKDDETTEEILSEEAPAEDAPAEEV